MTPQASEAEPFLGVLMLDTAFQRPPGDVAASESYPFPTRIARVAGADVPQIVAAAGPPRSIVDAFIREARLLETAGAFGLITSCGFMIHAQAELSAAVRIPVATSALVLGPSLLPMIGRGRLGVLTADADALDDRALAAAGLPPQRVAIQGLEHERLWRDAILAPKNRQPNQFDVAAVQEIAVRNAQALKAQTPQISAILLECGNLPPYASAIKTATGLPVWSVLDAAHLLYRAAFPARF